MRSKFVLTDDNEVTALSKLLIMRFSSFKLLIMRSSLPKLLIMRSKFVLTIDNEVTACLNY